MLPPSSQLEFSPWAISPQLFLPSREQQLQFCTVPPEMTFSGENSGWLQASSGLSQFEEQNKVRILIV